MLLVGINHDKENIKSVEKCFYNDHILFSLFVSVNSATHRGGRIFCNRYLLSPTGRLGILRGGLIQSNSQSSKTASLL